MRGVFRPPRHYLSSEGNPGGYFALNRPVISEHSQEIRQWNTILDWVQGSAAGTHLYLLLSYLQQNEIIDLNVDILADLFERQPSFEKLNLKMARFLIGRCLVEGNIPRGRVAMRNLDIVWKTLLLDQGALRNLLLITRNIFLPLRFRKAILS